MIIPFQNKLDNCRGKICFLSWADSPNADGGVSLLSVPPAAVYGNRDRELLPNSEKSRMGLTLNWVGSTISISTRGAEKPALICGGNVNHFTIRASCSFAFSFFFLLQITTLKLKNMSRN